MNNVDIKPVLDFLSGLKEHNDKSWFEEHRADYELARERFESFVDKLILAYGSIEDFGGITAKDCVMRIYRDTRFSKDKSPYKTNMGASLAPGGKKSTSLGYHLHLQPDNQSLIAGGLYMPSPEQLAKFRKAIDQDAAPFKAILNDKEFKKYFGSVEGEKVKTAPQGYSGAEHTIKVFKAMKPFLDYLNMILK